MEYINKGILFSHKEKGVPSQTELEIIVLSKKSQTQKDK